MRLGRLSIILLALGLGACAEVALEAPPPRGPEAVAALAKAGDPDAQVALGMMYEAGDGVPRDLDLAAALYRLAAERGNRLGQYALAELYARGRGVPRDDAEAVRWFRAAAEQGDPAAQFRLGYHYEHGLGVPQDYAEAARWYERARAGWRSLGRPLPGGERVTGTEAPAPSLHAPAAAAAPEGAGGQPAGPPAPEEPDAAPAGSSEEAAAPPPALVASPTEIAPEMPAPPTGATAPGEPKAAATAPRAPTTARGRLGGLWVHVASFRSPERALRFSDALSKDAGDLIGGLQIDLARVNLGETLGEWVRVRIGPLPGLAAAQALCDKLKERALYCAPLVN